VALFTRLVREAAALMAPFPDYDPYLLEHHHRGKSDAPSGTAVSLSETLLASLEGKDRLLPAPPEGEIDPRALHVVSLRAGHAFGTHEVGFDGEADRIVLRHEARGRQGFARGAILAAEWLVGKRGVYTLHDALFGSPTDA
jgi:4-hydroxy-tetrahydrodipicolinate reductase